MAERVHVVVDSSTCLAPAAAAGRGISVVPLLLEIDGTTYRDGYDIGVGEFYRSLRARGGSGHSTAAPSPGAYAAAFGAAAGDVLCLTVAQRLSSMFQSASIAAGMVDGGRRVVVLDSGTAAPGLQLLALAAAEAAATGLGLDALAARVASLSERVRMFGALATIEYLARSGRVPQVASWGASVLRVRPVVRFERGGARLVQLARGEGGARRAIVRQTLRAAVGGGAEARGDNVRCVVFHADAGSEAGRLQEQIRAGLPRAEVEISEFTPAMGVHTGPGVTGAALYVRAA